MFQHPTRPVRRHLWFRCWWFLQRRSPHRTWPFRGNTACNGASKTKRKRLVWSGKQKLSGRKERLGWRESEIERVCDGAAKTDWPRVGEFPKWRISEFCESESVLVKSVCVRGRCESTYFCFIPTRQFSLAKIWSDFLIETSMYINVISSRASFLFL